jgi:hypothetical protein
MRLNDVSRTLHDLLFRDKSQSLCSRAWDKRLAGPFLLWGLWVRIFGKAHCRASWLYYHGRK